MNTKVVNDLRQNVVTIKQKIEDKESEISMLLEEISSVELEDVIDIKVNEDDDSETPYQDLDGTDSTDTRTSIMKEVEVLETEILELNSELEHAENALMDVEEEF